MSTESTLMKYGFVKQEYDSQSKDFLRSGVKLKEVHIEAYPENPFTAPSSFMLLLRTSEKNAAVSINDDRLIVKKNDHQNTYLMNILLSKMSECFLRTSDSYSEHILNVQNIYYKITVFN